MIVAILQIVLSHFALSINMGYLSRMNNVVFRKLILLSLLALILTSSCSYQRFARKYLAVAKNEAPYDVVIVPGVPYIDSSNSGLIFTARILWSKYLYDRGITKNIIFSGSAVSTPYYEGRAMKIIADSLGIPSNHTFAEIRAEHSTENVWYSMKMAQKMGFKRIAVATDPFQTKMLLSFMKKRCGNLPFVPIVYDTVIVDRHKWQQQLPKADFKDAYCPNFVPLAKRQPFSERWRGTMGKHINFNE